MVDGQRLSAARMALGLSLNEVATAVGVSLQYIHRLEIGVTPGSAEMAEKLQKFLDKKSKGS